LTLRYAIIGSVVVVVGNDYNDWSEYNSDNSNDLTDNHQDLTNNDNIYDEMLKIATLRNNRYDKWKKKVISIDNNIATMNDNKEKKNFSQLIPIPKSNLINLYSVECIYVNTLKIK